MPTETDRLRIGIVGCGDVAHRHYLPALRSRSDRVAITAVADPNPAATEAIGAALADWSPEPGTYRSVEAMLEDDSLDAVVDLAPGPLHGA